MVMPARQLMQAVQAHRGVSQNRYQRQQRTGGRMSELQAKGCAAFRMASVSPMRSMAPRSERTQEWSAPASGTGADVRAKAVTIGAEDMPACITATSSGCGFRHQHCRSEPMRRWIRRWRTFYLVDVFVVRLLAPGRRCRSGTCLGAGLAMRQKQTEARAVEMTVMQRRMRDGRGRYRSLMREGRQRGDVSARHPVRCRQGAGWQFERLSG